MERSRQDARPSQRTAYFRVRPAFAKELQVAMNLTLRIWRQQSANASGSFHSYRVNDVTPDMSFLEMLDALNEDLINRGDPPVAFEHDCREGICGSRGFLINGVAHGGQRGTTVCPPPKRYNRMPTRNALLQGWRHHNARAVAGAGLPGDSRSDRESVSVRPNHSVW